MKKEVTYLIIALIFVGSFFLFLSINPSLKAISTNDYAKITSTSNLLKDGSMESFCIFDTASGKSYTDDTSRQECAVNYGKYYDHTPSYGLAQSHPYNWNLLYGTGVYKYTGSEIAYIGSKMAVLDKKTTDGWYGFGYTNIPMQEGKLYEAFIFSKRISKSGDDRDCTLDIRFLNAAGQTLTVLDKTEYSYGSLEQGSADWAKIYAKAISPIGTTQGGFQIWCAENGLYTYLIDGQYIGTTTACTTGQTQACGEFTTGACHKGIKTCNNNGIWGSCVGSVNPISEICGNNIDDNCNGISDVNEPLCENSTPAINYNNYIIGTGVVGLIGAGIYLLRKRR